MMVVKRGSRVPALTAAGTDGPREPYCSHVLSHAGCRERSNATGGQTGRRRRARAPRRAGVRGGRRWRWREWCGGGGCARGAPLSVRRWPQCAARAAPAGGSGQKAWGESRGGHRAARGGGAQPPRTVARRHGRAEAERAAGAAAPAAEQADRRSPRRERATEAVVQAEAPAPARLARARVVQGGDCRASRPAPAVPRGVDRVEADQLGRRCRRHAVGDQCLPATAAA